MLLSILDVGAFALGFIELLLVIRLAKRRIPIRVFEYLIIGLGFAGSKFDFILAYGRPAVLIHFVQVLIMATVIIWTYRRLEVSPGAVGKR